MKKRTIPQIRKRLYELATLHGIPELRVLADETFRTPAVRRAPNKRRRLDAKLADDIRIFAKRNPNAQMNDIANIFNVNQGRVSEALNNKV